jgi:hypothetical protein
MTMSRRHNVYREGRVHVQAEMCSTCIFRPGNLMGLHSGRVRGMVDEALTDESAIVCHQTLDGPDGSVCRGFFDRHETAPLVLAKQLDLVEWA